MPTDSALQALEILRDPSNFKWYFTLLLSIVVYAYATEVERRNWSLVFAGLAYWGMDWFNEIWNALFFKATNYAPVWGAPGGGTAYLILIGLNIEICAMFAVAGIAYCKMLPKDKTMKIWGIPNRIFFAVMNAIICVGIEIGLNAVNALTWDYWWWSAKFPFLIILCGYLPFFLVSYWVFDMKTIKSKAITVGSIWGFDALCLIIFGGILHWI